MTIAYKFLLLVFIGSCTYSVALAQTQDHNIQSTEAGGQVQVITGKLIHKGWAKTMQSYCASGSDYYVISNEDGQWVVKMEDVKDSTSLSNAVNHQVSASGIMDVHVIHPKDDGMQHPIDPMGGNSGVTCTTFVIRSMKTIDN